jgi:hypothetical protein
MAGRGTVNRTVQIGVESTPGTAVAANKSLPTMSLTLSRQLESKEFRAQGYKAAGEVPIVKDFGTGTLSGPLNYTEIVYLLNTLVTGVIATPGGGTLSRTHTFSPSLTGTDAFKTLTIQEGDSTAAVQMANSLLTDFGISISLDDASVTGTILGKAPTNTTLTGSPTVVSQYSVTPRQVDLFMDTTFGGIGGTKVTDALAVNAQFNNKQAPKWVLNTAEASWKETIEVVPDLSFSFTTEHNAQSRALFASITSTANPTQYLRLKATGSIIEGALPYYFQLDVAAKVNALEQTDEDGVWGYRYDCTPIADAGLALAWKVVVQNALTAL